MYSIENCLLNSKLLIQQDLDKLEQKGAPHIFSVAFSHCQSFAWEQPLGKHAIAVEILVNNKSVCQGAKFDIESDFVRLLDEEVSDSFGKHRIQIASSMI